MKITLPKVGIYVFAHTEKDSEAARKYLLHAVKRYCAMCGIEEIPEEKLRVERTEKGKPFFPDCPEIRFSISHSGTYWACAVAQQEIGMDLQEHVLLKNETREAAAIRFRKMACRFFHPAEAVFVESESYDRFFMVWTAREAYVKHTGQGIDREFSEFCVLSKEDTGEAHEWEALGKWFWRSEFDAMYSLCVCLEQQSECMIVSF